MRSEDAILHSISLLYLLASTGRLFFYWPTYKAIIRCQNGAASSSALSHGYFMFSFGVAALYFATVVVDMWAALVSTANCLALLLITMTILWKRRAANRVAYSDEERVLLVDAPALPSFLSGPTVKG